MNPAARFASSLVLAAAFASPAIGGDVADLLLAYREGAGPQRVETRRSLLALGPAAVPEILSLRAGLAPEQGLLDDGTRVLLDEALDTWSAEAVVASAVRAAATTAPLPLRLAAIDLIGARGSVNDIGGWIEALGTLEPALLSHPRIAARVEVAAARFLDRDPGAYRALSGRLPDVPSALLPTLARALGRAGHDEGCALLGRFLGRAHDLDLVVLETLGRWPAGSPTRHAGEVTAFVSPYLDAADPELRRMAALSIGRLREIDHLDTLLSMFADDDPRVRRGALWAAQEITGLNWPDDGDSWSRWRAQEESWLGARSDALQREIRGDDPAAAIAALREISAHPLARTSLARVVEEAVSHPDERVAVAACRALERMRHPASLPALADALDDHRAGVKAAASRAFTTLTE